MFPRPEPQFHDDWWTMDHLIPILLVLLLIGVIIWAVVRLTRNPTASSADRSTHPAAPSSVGPDPALELVRNRYARGEIDRDAFLQTSRDLGADLRGGSPQAGAAAPPETHTA